MTQNVSHKTQGITLIEALVATVAGVIVLGAVATVLLTAITVNATGSLAASATVFDGRVEERLRTLSLEATSAVGALNGSRFTLTHDGSATLKTNPLANAPDVLTPNAWTPGQAPAGGGIQFLAIAADFNAGFVDPRFPFNDRGTKTPTVRPVFDKATDVDPYPTISKAVTNAQDFERTALMYWFVDSAGQESTIYYAEVNQKELKNLPNISGAPQSFRQLSAAQIGAFVGSLKARAGSQVLAQNVSLFTIAPIGGATNPTDIAWQIYYRVARF